MLKLLALLLAGYAAVCLLLFLTQRSMIYYPVPSAAAPPATRTPLDVDGAVLQNWVVRREGRRALLYFGGNAEDVGANAAPFAAAITDRTLVFANYRGYGGSTGAPSERALVADAVALFDSLAADYGDIAVVGRSLGSGVAVQLAAQRPVRKLVLVTPFDSIVSVGQAAMPWIPVTLPARDRFESAKVAPQVRAPTLILVATDDTVVRPKHAMALRAAFEPGIARVVEAQGFGHNDLQLWPAYHAHIAKFVH